MRAWIGSRIDDGTTAVFAIDRSPRPSLEEINSALGELHRLNDEATDPAREAALLAHKDELLARMEASERVGEVIALHPGEGRRFDWGQDSPAGFELARAILTDAVGDPPPHHVADHYVADIVARLPRDRFRIEAADVHDWLIGRGLFVEAELAAHRGGLDPDGGPALRLATPDEPIGGADPQAGCGPAPTGPDP